MCYSEDVRSHFSLPPNMEVILWQTHFVVLFAHLTTLKAPIIASVPIIAAA